MSCLSGNVIKTVYENNWMKPHDMSLGLASYPLSMKLGYWLTKTGRLSFSSWKRLPIPHVVSTSFQEVLGITGDVAHEVLRYMCRPGCCFWVALVWLEVLESSPERCWKMVFNVWKVRQRLLGEKSEYSIEDPYVLYSTHTQGGNFREGWQFGVIISSVLLL